jgi:hypothetical protein
MMAVGWLCGLWLQVAASTPSVRLTAAEARVPLEREWEFSAASPGVQQQPSGTGETLPSCFQELVCFLWTCAGCLHLQR